MSLKAANQAYRGRHFTAAMQAYLEALYRTPGLTNVLLPNIRRTAEAYQAQFPAGEFHRVGVCGWSLTHNAAGRAYTLAQLHQQSAQVELVGALFPRYGDAVWEPIRAGELSVDAFHLGPGQDFMGPALRMVAAHPFQLVHLSKPRMPNIVFGMLYKLLWNARVLVDIDDDELAFVGGSLADTPELEGQALGKLPKPHRLPGLPWTRIAVRLAPLFDGLTVSNPVLQEWFGGRIVRHARSEADFDPDQFDTQALRQRYGLPARDRVVLFLGTPRAHKGLIETAEALERLGRDDLTFLIIGSFGNDEQWIVQKLQAFRHLKLHFMPNQPFDAVPELVAMADVCLALQDPDSQVTTAQVPAKLTDALAMGKAVIATRNPALSDLDLDDLVLLSDWSDLAEKLRLALSDTHQAEQMAVRRRRKFLEEFSMRVNGQRVQQAISALSEAQDEPLLNRMRVILPHFKSFPRALLDLRPAKQLGLDKTGIATRRLAEILAQDCPPGLEETLQDSRESLERSVDALRHRSGLPLVSVIMPTWNRAAILAEAIQSVLDQCYENWELWVCDDGSTDSTMDVVCQFSDPRVHYLPLDNAGAAAARNQGLKRARGDIIAYLDSDNIWLPEYLNRMVSALLEQPGHSCAYANYLDYRVDSAGRIRVKAFERPLFNQERLLEKNYIDLNSFVHRRELYDCFGGFTESLSRRQDYDLIIKYTWLRDPLYVEDIVTLYQRNDSLDQLTVIKKHDSSPVRIIDGNIARYLSSGLPLPPKRAVQRVTVLSWDMSRNHFSKAFAVAEALSVDYDVQLISFRFFEEEIFPPLKDVRPDFETVYIQGSEFPDFFQAVRQALAAVSGDLIYVVKPRVPSLGLALLANAETGVPIVLEINDLESVVQSPDREASLSGVNLESVSVSDVELLNPYATLWSRMLEPLAGELPVLLTHNCNIDSHFGSQCLYMRNLKDERVYDPALYDREAIRAELGFEPRDRVILFGGLIRKHKGIYELIELAERLGDPRYKLLFVGSRLSPDQRELVARHGERLKMLPPQDRGAMARINLAADLVVLWLNPDVPASQYQMPYKATDAFAMGPLVIANDISDLGILGRQGYLRLVPFGDWDAMDRVVKSHFSGKSVGAETAAAARRLFLRQFSYPAGRAAFELAARRATAEPAEPYPAAVAFADFFNRFFMERGTRNREFFSLQGVTGLHDPAVSKADLAASIMVWCGDGNCPLSPTDGTGEIAVLMPAANLGPALQTARQMVLRAGQPLKIVVLFTPSWSDQCGLLNRSLESSSAEFVVLCSPNLVPGMNWLDEAQRSFNEPDLDVLLFNSGHADHDSPPFLMARADWLKAMPVSDRWRPDETLVQNVQRVASLARDKQRQAWNADAVLLDLTPLAGKLYAEADQAIDPHLLAKPRPGLWQRFMGLIGGRAEPADAPESSDEKPAGAHGDTRIQIHRTDSLARQMDQAGASVAVIMPAIRPAQAMTTARLLLERAGMELAVHVVIDVRRQGFVATLNQAARSTCADYIVYLAEDAVPGENWLKVAFDALERSGKGLLAFNCGKWKGRIASFGMVRRQWVNALYGKDVFHPGYRAHRADNELTAIARATDQFMYCAEALLIENDHRKIRLDLGLQAANVEDRKLFRQRYEKAFHGLAPAEALHKLRKDYTPAASLPEEGDGS